MLSRDPTFIGRVRQVTGSSVIVDLDEELASMAPIYEGEIRPIGQVGSLVRIAQGPVDLLCSVALAGVSEEPGGGEHGRRWLEVELLGEIHRTTRQFLRGTAAYPGLDDEVHFATANDLQLVYRSTGVNHVRLGRLAAADVPVALDVGKLVARHSVVVGATGTGKTSAVCAVLQGLERDWTSANVVVIDPHGEYAHALHTSAVRSVLATGARLQLRVPFWALPSKDILRALTGTTAGTQTTTRFSELVAEGRQAFAKNAEWVRLDAGAITSETPIPFNIREVWYRLDFENRETRNNKNDPNTVTCHDVGSAQELRPAIFEPYGAGATPPAKATTFGKHGNTPERLRRGLLDPRLEFLDLDGDWTDEDPLPSIVADWLGGAKPLSILDFSGVPSDAAGLAIGVVLHILFELAVRAPLTGPGIGRPHPVLVVLEEAHRYLTGSTMASQTANRIAREGRKYGVGLMLVTQRPSELPDTALSQSGTIIALRLGNSGDQAKVRTALPESLSGLATALSSLRTGEAIISGEAVVIPSRALVDLPEPRPLADDPTLASWRATPNVVDVSAALKSWRGEADSDG